MVAERSAGLKAKALKTDKLQRWGTTRNRRSMGMHVRTILTHILVAVLFLSSCVQNQGVRSTRTVKKAGGNVAGGGGDGKGSAPGEGGLGNTTDDILENGKAELRHIVDPFDGTYKTKVSLPKNFTGPLYLSGLNITSLSDRLLTVRFNFGRDLEPIEVPATVGRAPGITPQTEIEVLILDMDSRPFENIRLLYDLYDYNDYDSDDDGVEFESDDTLNEPVSDIRNGGLYCRGLLLQHDPTFKGSSNNSKCDALGERCLYAYAKIKDSGLVDSSNIAKVPSEPHVYLNLGETDTDSIETALKVALPDVNDETYFQNVFGLNLGSSVSVNLPSSSLNFGDKVEITDNSVSPAVQTDYTYEGPYRPIAIDEWQISHLAILSDITTSSPSGKVYPTGLFQDFADNSTGDTTYDCQAAGETTGCAHRGIKSFLFPRSGKMALSANVNHYASTSPIYGAGGRALTSLVSSGTSDYMDGVNIRVTNFDSFVNEGISSCNVTATIDILAKDMESGKNVTLSSNKNVKLQLVRSSLTDYQGREVLYSSMKTCTNSQACGASECCFNSRCWSKELVSQCLEEVPTVGNNQVGETCSSDYDCSSFCCNTNTGTCAVHVNTEQQKVLCSKAPGQRCVAKEWCRKENVSQCFIVKTGLDPQGKQLCALRCYNVPTFGDCRDGTCQPPAVPEVPTFDAENPDCTDAIDPPTQFNN